MFQWPSKSSADVLDYGINWAEFLGSDAITASAWTIAPDGLTETRSSFLPQITTIWLGDGTPNQLYTVTNTITTALGRVVDQSVNILVTNN